MNPDHAPRQFSWLTIILAVLTVITFLAASPSQERIVPVLRGGYGGSFESTKTVSSPPTTMSEAPSSGSTQDSIAPAPYPYPTGTAAVTDTREFLKIYYNAQMKTRNVAGLFRRVETTVRGYEGRIDSESSAPGAAYVSFVVPQSKYDAFRTELESLVGSRFLTISINSENKLGEKQSIEEQATSASNTLTSYQAARASLVALHLKEVNALNAQIAIATSTELASLKAKLANENATYSTHLATADANIKSVKDWQKAIANNDQAFLDDIATANGTVSITHVTLWEVAQLYLPGYWIPGIFALLTILSYARDRRRRPVLA